MQERTAVRAGDNLEDEGSDVRRSKRIEVAAAVIFNDLGQFLLAQRPPGKPYAGFWEFPGGKVERDESAQQALVRELQEELGIDAVTVYPWVTRDFDYAHASVRLRFFRVLEWGGSLHGRESQVFSWQTVENINVDPILPANGPILRALQLPNVYGITHAARLGLDLQLESLEHALRRGLRLIQVRERELAGDLLQDFCAQVVRIARPYGARVLVNGPVEIAASADGVHMTATRLMAAESRPDCNWCAASCHNARELQQALKIGVDFVVLGPVLTTTSHPGAVPLGWQACAQLIQDYPLPVFLLGGLHADDLRSAWSCGAHGVAMMRGAWTHVSGLS